MSEPGNRVSNASKLINLRDSRNQRRTSVARNKTEAEYLVVIAQEDDWALALCWSWAGKGVAEAKSVDRATHALEGKNHLVVSAGDAYV